MREKRTLVVLIHFRSNSRSIQSMNGRHGWMEASSASAPTSTQNDTHQNRTASMRFTCSNLRGYIRMLQQQSKQKPAVIAAVKTWMSPYSGSPFPTLFTQPNTTYPARLAVHRSRELCILSRFRAVVEQVNSARYGACALSDRISFKFIFWSQKALGSYCLWFVTLRIVRQVEKA